MVCVKDGVRMGGVKGFTAGERAYLSSLAAVDEVDGRSRIHYADWFRVGCMRRYRAGERPVALFREAGLDPKLIGYKRIERAFARWRHADRTPPPDTTTKPNPKPVSRPKPAASVSDLRDRLIAAQALRIQELEEELQTLKQS